MSTTQYDPRIHHRQSIRLKGHDYAGGGLYFVTTCAHRDAGEIFAGSIGSGNGRPRVGGNAAHLVPGLVFGALWGSAFPGDREIV